MDTATMERISVNPESPIRELGTRLWLSDTAVSTTWEIGESTSITVMIALRMASSETVWFERYRIGGSFTGLTNSRSVLVTESPPCAAVTWMSTVPVWFTPGCAVRRNRFGDGPVLIRETESPLAGRMDVFPE